MVVCFLLDGASIACELERSPHLRDKPVALTGDSGAIRCVSPLAQSAGVMEGCDSSTARSLCRGLVVLPYDREHYMFAMQSAWDAVAVESNTVEPVEPELCYAEFTGIDVVERVRGVVSIIAGLYGIRATAGIGDTKMLARAAAQRASRLADRDYVVEVECGSELSFLSGISLDTVGPLPAKLLQRFRNLGIRTLGDARKVPKPELTRQAGREWGHRLLRLCAGLDDDPVKAVWPHPYLENAVDFEDEVGDAVRVHGALRQCSDRIARRLQGRYCRALTLTMQLADYSHVSETETLANPVCSADQLYRCALRLLARLNLALPILGVNLRADNIDSGGGLQLTLLDLGDALEGYPHERKRSLDARVKVLQSKYGQQMLVQGGRMLGARHVDCWISPLGKKNDEQVTVAIDEQGFPMRYRRSGGRWGRDMWEYQVCRVMDRWKSVEWSWGEVAETDCYWVETEPYGVYELHRLGDGWRLRAVYD